MNLSQSLSTDGSPPVLYSRFSDPRDVATRRRNANLLREKLNPKVMRRASMAEKLAPAEELPHLEKRCSLRAVRSSGAEVRAQESLFPDIIPLRKSLVQIREDVSTLKDLGVTTGASVPSELNIFRECPPRKLVMSTFDLWGPQHAKLAMKKLGFYEAFRTMEGRDRRESLKMEWVQEEKFNPRIADDVSLMKALNTPMMTTNRSCAEIRLSTARVKGREEPIKAKTLTSIIDSCERLTKETRVYRKTLDPAGRNREKTKIKEK